MASVTTTSTRFFTGFALGLIPAVIFAAVGLRFLDRTYETASYDEIVEAQLHAGGIYSSALRDDFYDYKLALYRATKPRVIAIGSSRAWGFRDLGFRVPFVTLGGPVRSIADGERLLADLKAAGPMPEVVLFAIDYWWFNDRWNPDSSDESYKEVVERRLGLPFRPAMWLTAGKIGPRDLLMPDRDTKPLPPTYGVFARYSLRGFAPDGHYRYFSDAFGLSAADKHFEQAVGQIRKGRGRYVFGARVSEERLARFRALVGAFEASGSRVITIIPPVASVVRTENARQGEKLAYIADVFARLHAWGLARYQFHDLAALGADDCELVDAYHGGEVLYLRMVLAIANDRDSGLEPYVDRVALRTAIEHATGHVLADADAFPPYKEVDFLGLGCKK